METSFEWTNLVASVLAGLTLMLIGRRLYWLFLATAGFLVTSLLTHAALPVGQDAWWWMLLPMFVGLFGAFLSIFLQKILLRLGGLMSGAYLGYFLLEPLLAYPWPWIGFVAGALIGLASILYLFNGALILLTSLLGATLLLEPMDASPEARLVVTGALTLAGCLIQKRQKAIEPRKGKDQKGDA